MGEPILAAVDDPEKAKAAEGAATDTTTTPDTKTDTTTDTTKAAGPAAKPEEGLPGVSMDLLDLIDDKATEASRPGTDTSKGTVPDRSSAISPSQDLGSGKAHGGL